MPLHSPTGLEGWATRKGIHQGLMDIFLGLLLSHHHCAGYQYAVIWPEERLVSVCVIGCQREKYPSGVNGHFFRVIHTVGPFLKRKVSF